MFHLFTFQIRQDVFTNKISITLCVRIELAHTMMMAMPTTQQQQQLNKYS